MRADSILHEVANLTAAKAKEVYYWGAPTSTLNWCEEDYTVTKLIAEIVNTTTNSWVLFCLISIWAVFKFNYPRRYIVLWLGCCVVGVGSWFFHMTLQWEWQVLGDELPMIIASSCYLFTVLEITPSSEPKSVQRESILKNSALCISLTLFICISYLYNQSAVFHQVSFGLLIVLCVLRSYGLLTTFLPSDDPDPELREKRRQIMKILKRGALIFFLGFVCWNIDNNFCQSLRQARIQMGRPLGFLLQLHGWWHLMTGYGSILMATSGQFLTLILRDGHQHYELQMWWGWFPLVVRSGYLGCYVGDKVA